MWRPSTSRTSAADTAANPRLTDPAGRWCLLAVVAQGISHVTTQLVLLREMLAVYSGNELVMGVLLGSWLLLTGLGARLGRW